MVHPVALFLRTVRARAYPRVIGMRRYPSWIVQEAVLPLLSISAFAFVYRAMEAPEQYIGFVILGGAMTAFWLNVLWSIGAQLYWERDTGNLEMYIMAPTSMMAVLAGMAVGGMVLTLVRASVILLSGWLLFHISFAPSSWWWLSGVFIVTLLALYGLGMMFASLFLIGGRATWHMVNLLQEPVYLLSGMNFPIRILPAIVSTFAAIIPLSLGMDAMRQLIFVDIEGLLPVRVEAAILFILSIVFIALAQRCLIYLERRAREDGRLTVRWQ